MATLPNYGTPALNNDPMAQRILRDRNSVGTLNNRTLGRSIPQYERRQSRFDEVAAPMPQATVEPAVSRFGQVAQQAAAAKAASTSSTPMVPMVSPTTAKAAGTLATARSLIGTPYIWDGTTTKGFDCSGFVQYVARQNGIKIPRSASMQYGYLQKKGRLTKTDSWKSANPGDLIFYASSASPSGWHVGLYVGNGKIIDAAGKRTGVKYSNAGKSPIRGIGRM